MEIEINQEELKNILSCLSYRRMTLGNEIHEQEQKILNEIKEADLKTVSCCGMMLNITIRKHEELLDITRRLLKWKNY